MFYHDKFNKVVDDYKKGRITKKVALDRIRVIDYELVTFKLLELSER